jgi:hypothetical protein
VSVFREGRRLPGGGVGTAEVGVFSSRLVQFFGGGAGTGIFQKLTGTGLRTRPKIGKETDCRDSHNYYFTLELAVIRAESRHNLIFLSKFFSSLKRVVFI